MEVRREDQDKINRFSRLHQRELTLKEELEGKSVSIIKNTLSLRLLPTWRVDQAVQKEKEELDDLSTELELADEDEKIQYASPYSETTIFERN